MREVLYSTTVFLVHGDEYLFLHRTGKVGVDKNRLNGIGGKLEPGENFLSSAIRETEEETGYIVRAKDVKFSGLINLHGGYPQDWVMCFFKINVNSKKIPHYQIGKGRRLVDPSEVRALIKHQNTGELK